MPGAITFMGLLTVSVAVWCRRCPVANASTAPVFRASMHVPPSILITIAMIGFGRFLDFGIRRYQTTIWRCMRTHVWDRLESIRPRDLHLVLANRVSHWLNSDDDDVHLRLAFVYLGVTSCWCWLFASMFLMLIKVGSSPLTDEIVTLYAMRFVCQSVMIFVAYITVLAVLSRMHFITRGIDAFAKRLRASANPRVATFGYGVERSAVGLIWSLVWSAAAAIVVWLVAVVLFQDFRHAAIIAFVNMIFDMISFGATAWLLRLSTRGSTVTTTTTLRLLVCVVLDVVSASVLAFVSYVFILYCYGWIGYRWDSSGPMNGFLAMMMVTALIPTLLLALGVVGLFLLKASQVVTREILKYAVDLIALPEKEDEALPFTTLGFFAGSLVLIGHGAAWLIRWV